jgi:REP element-mobilizing transposase RayT
MRCGPVHRALRRVLQRYLGRDEFRVVHISIQKNHLHLLVEANDRRELTRGMQSFAINAARAINAVSSRSGKVFAHRYHATQIRTATHARHALGYVLNNWRRHREDVASRQALAGKLDPYASGLGFTGWAQRVRVRVPDSYVPLPVSPPMTGLLRFDWQRFGLVDLYETPGPVVAPT